jgi:hypothetical protein
MDRDLGMLGGYVAGGPDKSPPIQIGHCEYGPLIFCRIGWSRPRRHQRPQFPPHLQQAGGFFTSISSNGTHDGSAIIWAVGRPTSTTTPNVTLYALNGTATGTTLPLLLLGGRGNLVELEHQRQYRASGGERQSFTSPAIGC